MVRIPCLKHKFKLYQRHTIEKVNQIEVSRKYLYVVCTVSSPPIKFQRRYIGVDLNSTHHIAVAAFPCTGKVWKFGKQASIRKKYFKLRQRFQRDGKFQKVKELREKEKHVIYNLNHHISNKIVREAKRNNADIAVEDLTGIRKPKRKGGRASSEALVYELKQPKTDLLGAVTQQMIFARAWCHRNSAELNVSTSDSFGSYTGQKGIPLWEDGGNGTQEEHLSARQLVTRVLSTTTRSADRKLPGTYQIQNLLARDGFSEAFSSSFRAKIRDSFLEVLPESQIPTEIIALHFRAGEILNMRERYIPARNYRDFLSTLRKRFPNLPVHVFTNKRPSEKEDPEFDSVFEGCILHDGTPSILATWRVFMEARVYVMARSSFSHVPALCRADKDVTTFYKPFWHPPLGHWEKW